MSLKTFHLIFVSASITMSVFLGIWAGMAYRDSGSTLHLSFAISSGVAVAGLLWYGKYFLRKLKHISYL